MSGRRGRHYLSEMRNGSQRKPPPLLDTPSHASVQHLLENMRHDFDTTSQNFHLKSKRQFPSRQSPTQQFDQHDIRAIRPVKPFPTEDIHRHARHEIERQFVNKEFDMPRRRQRSERQFEVFDMLRMRPEKYSLIEEFDMPRRRRETDTFDQSQLELESMFDLSRSTYHDSRENNNGSDTAFEDLNFFPRGRGTERNLSPEVFNTSPTRPKRHQLLPDDVDLRTMINYKRQLAAKNFYQPITKIKFSPVLSPVVHKFRRHFLSEDIDLPPTRPNSGRPFQPEECDISSSRPKSTRQLRSDEFNLPLTRPNPERDFQTEVFDVPPRRHNSDRYFQPEEFDLPPIRPKSDRPFQPEEFDLPPTGPKFERHELPLEDFSQSPVRSGRQFPPKFPPDTTHAGLSCKRALLPTPGEESYKKQKIETSSSKVLLPPPNHTFPKSGLLPIPTHAGLPPRPLQRAPECRVPREAINTGTPLRGLLPLVEPGMQHSGPSCLRMQKYVFSRPSRTPVPKLEKQDYSVKVKKLSNILPLPGPQMQPLVRDVESPTNLKKRPLLPTPPKPGIIFKNKPLLQISSKIIDQSIIPPLLQAPCPPINKWDNNKNGRINIGNRRPIFKEPMMTPPMLPPRISKISQHYKKNLAAPDYYPLDSNESGRKRPLLPNPDLF